MSKLNRRDKITNASSNILTIDKFFILSTEIDEMKSSNKKMTIEDIVKNTYSNYHHLSNIKFLLYYLYTDECVDVHIRNMIPNAYKIISILVSQYHRDIQYGGFSINNLPLLCTNNIKHKMAAVSVDENYILYGCEKCNKHFSIRKFTFDEFIVSLSVVKDIISLKLQCSPSSYRGSNSNEEIIFLNVLDIIDIIYKDISISVFERFFDIMNI